MRREAFACRRGWTHRLVMYRGDDKKLLQNELARLSSDEYAEKEHGTALQLLDFARIRLLVALQKKVNDWNNPDSALSRFRTYEYYTRWTKAISWCLSEIEKMQKDVALNTGCKISVWVHGHGSESQPVNLNLIIPDGKSSSVGFDYELWESVVFDPIPESMWNCFAFLAGPVYTKTDIEVAKRVYRESIDILRAYGVEPE